MLATSVDSGHHPNEDHYQHTDKLADGPAMSQGP